MSISHKYVPPVTKKNATNITGIVWRGQSLHFS